MATNCPNCNGIVDNKGQHISGKYGKIDPELLFELDPSDLWYCVAYNDQYAWAEPIPEPPSIPKGLRMLH